MYRGHHLIYLTTTGVCLVDASNNYSTLILMGNASGKGGGATGVSTEAAKVAVAGVLAEKNLQKFEPLRSRLSSKNIFDAQALKLHEHDVLKCYEICQAEIKTKVKEVYNNNEAIVASMNEHKKGYKDALAAMERRAAASTIKIHGLKHEMLALEDVLSVTAADVASLFKQAGRLDAELNEMVYTDTDEFVAHPSRNSV